MNEITRLCRETIESLYEAETTGDAEEALRRLASFWDKTLAIYAYEAIVTLSSVNVEDALIIAEVGRLMISLAARNASLTPSLIETVLNVVAITSFAAGIDAEQTFMKSSMMISMPDESQGGEDNASTES